MTKSEAGERGLPKTRSGVVVSAKMQNTVVVAIKRLDRHAKYGKYVRVTKKFFAHDTNNECKEGDTVQIVETRPLSKLKRWRVQKIITRAVEV